MLDAAGALPPRLVGVDVVPGCDSERLLGDKAEGRPGCGYAHLVARLPEAPDHAGRLVRRDAARYPDEYLRHARSIGGPRWEYTNPPPEGATDRRGNRSERGPLFGARPRAEG